MDKILLEQVKSAIEPVINEKGLLLDKLNFVKKGRDFYLEVYVEKEDDTTSLEDVCAVSDVISKKLDEVDLIEENYILDVSTSGAEKPIEDFSKFPKYVGKYIYVKIRNPIDGFNDFEGTLESADEEKIVLSYRIKTRTKKVEIKLENITRSNLAIKF